MKRKQELREEEDNVGVGVGVVCKLGDGSSWLRGPLIGRGTFGSVFSVRLRNSRSKFSCFPRIMAVKSAEVSASATLQKEKEVLCNVRGCPNVVHCFGEEVTVGQSGEMFYNLLLEFASAGTLASLIKKCAGPLPESDVRRHTRAILRGLHHIHGRGYVHCDLKPENVLLVGEDSNALVAKIADFGLAKRVMTGAAAAAARKRRRLTQPYCLRGTVLYISPEAVSDGEQEPGVDIWALGCVVLEMLTGKPAWGAQKDLNRESLLSMIGSGLQFPEIPSGISKEARGFLKGCLVRKPMFRWTTEMLLNHPFVSGINGEEGGEYQKFVCDNDCLVEEDLVVEGFSSMNGLLSDTDDESDSSSSSSSS